MSRLSPRLSTAVSAVCAALSLFSLYAVFFPLERGPQFTVTIFLAVALPLCFLTYRTGVRIGPGVVDWVLAAAALAVCVYRS